MKTLLGLSAMLLASTAMAQSYGYPDRGYEDYRGGYGNGYGQVFRCDSNDNRQRYCPADTRGGVQLVRQVSKTRCQQGYNWGYDRGGVWVSGGCRAEFASGRGGGWNGGYPGNGNAYGQVIRCDSNDGRQNYCRANTRGGVQVVRQISKARCQEGYNWGYDRGGIWVDRGCRAEFASGRSGGWGGGYPGNGDGYGYGRTIRCDSNDNRQKYCPADTRSGVQLTRQISKTRCQEGYNWGYDRGGIWVDRGCRAEFRIY
ncbi:MAG TPA: DUF3011 domain-containing protein [Pseudoxanthomonas sp.]|nr:DUF3011 domain-containing protein [Pseudoxanthomonas sp.]